MGFLLLLFFFASEILLLSAPAFFLLWFAPTIVVFGIVGVLWCLTHGTGWIYRRMRGLPKPPRYFGPTEPRLGPFGIYHRPVRR